MSPSYTVRGFRPADGPGLEMVHRRAIMATAGGHYTEAECRSWAHNIRARAYGKIAATSETFLVAEMVHGPLAGFCSYALDDDDTGRICGLYTDPAFQGLGVATTLMSAGERAMVGQGAKALVIEASLAALSFYHRHGYREVNRVSRPTRGGLAIVVANLSKSAADAL